MAGPTMSPSPHTPLSMPKACRCTTPHRIVKRECLDIVCSSRLVLGSETGFI